MPRFLRVLILPLLAASLACGGEEDDKKKPQGSAETVPGKKPMSERKPNRLAKEKSPYLLQHAYNPVDWYPWGKEAFERAKKEDKPIFLSIGYSTCHWCHVMEHESFENDEIAAYLNAHFISIKVDREERPDVDDVYMTAVQYGMRIQGGWPLSVWLTPDREPFVGGTYFPPEEKFGRPGFLEILKKIHAWWEDPERRPKLEEQGGQISELVKMVGEHSDPSETGPATLEEGAKMIEAAFDEQFGGFGSEPKFPSPSTLDFLMRRAVRKGNDLALHQVRKTLDAMQNGGIHDHVGGGFHRYSVTRNWLVPHFEKMLYDNAQLLGLYAWAHLVTGDERYAATARDIATWVRREMTHPDGGFYSAQDADDPGGPEGEGGFYIWDPKEIRELFDDKQAEVVLAWFGIADTGNWFVHGHQENPGKTILEIKKTSEQVGKLLKLPAAEVEATVQNAIARMYEVREKRPKPITDTKVLTAWNGLMISGYCRAYQTLGDAEFLAAAEKAGGFLRTHLTREDGRLYRRWREGEAAHDGVLPDYAYTIAAYLDLYETTFDQAWLAEALRLNAVVLDSFQDKQGGAFYFTSKQAERLIARGKGGQDNARPSGNAVMACNLLRISELSGDLKARELAQNTIDYYGTMMTGSSLGFGALLAALDFAQGPREIFIAGDPDNADTQSLIRAVWRNPDPNRVVALVQPGLEKLLPPAAGKTPVDGKPAAYVCRNFTCDAPTTDPADLAWDAAKGD